MKCFSSRVRRHFRQKDVDVEYFPLVIDWVCEDCGYKGIPIVFCNEEDYVNFISIHEKGDDRNKKG